MSPVETMQSGLLAAGLAMAAVSVALVIDLRGFGTLWRSWRAVVTTFSIFFGVSLCLIGLLVGRAGPTA